MDDWKDIYISRNLKSWAARQQPPPENRRRLLRVAVFIRITRGQQYASWLLDDLKTHFSPPKNQYQLPSEWQAEAISQSRIWSFHLANIWRLAT